MKLLEKSIKLARELTFHEQKFKVAAFIYSGNKLLSIGQNNQSVTNAKAHYFGRRFGVQKFVEYSFIHAEIDAISRLWGKYHISSKDRMIVVRLNKSDQPCMAKPCVNCQVILDSLGITKIDWSK